MRRFPTIPAAMCIALMGMAPIADARALTLIYQENHNDVSGGPLRLVATKPFDGQKLDQTPERVSISFSQPIRPGKSYIRLYDPFGHPVQVGELDANGMEIFVTVPELSPGRYRVKWKARCQCDGDSEINDSFYFTVR